MLKEWMRVDCKEEDRKRYRHRRNIKVFRMQRRARWIEYTFITMLEVDNRGNRESPEEFRL